MALAQIELYTGDTEVAWRHVDTQMKPLEKSMLLRIQGLRIEATYLRARLALATASGGQLQRRLQIASRLADQLAKEHMGWSNPMAAVVRAAIAKRRGEDAQAAALITQAIAGFEAADMALYAAAARRRLGEVVGGDRGQELTVQADESMRKQQIKNPVAFANLLMPIC